MIETIRAAIRENRIRPGVFASLMSDFIFKGLTDEQHETLEKQLYKNPEELDYTPTDLAVPYLLIAMRVLVPDAEMLKKYPPPLFIKQIAFRKQKELKKKQEELDKLEGSNAAAETLESEIQELKQWEIISASKIAPLDPNRILEESEVLEAGKALEGLSLPRTEEDTEALNNAVIKLTKTEKWTKEQAERLVRNLAFLEDL